MPTVHMAQLKHKNAKAHIFIATPTYGELKGSYVHSLFTAQAALSAQKFDVTLCIKVGDCHVDDARNDLCRLFLESDATHLMFIDADVGFSNMAMLRLYNMDKDIAAGIYPHKNDEESFPVMTLETKVNPAGHVRVKGVPGGFMMIKREVIERLDEKAASKGRWPPKGSYGGTRGITEIFERTIESGRSRRSGDYEFCFKAVEAGYEIWVDPDLRFQHTGDKVWEGALSKYWLRRNGRMEGLFADMLRNVVEIGTLTPESFSVLDDTWDNSPWSLDYAMCHILWNAVWGFRAQHGHKPNVLETGSGISSLIILAAGCRLTSLESSISWMAKTEDYIREFDPKYLKALKYCPIVNYPELGVDWYRVDNEIKKKEYQIALIDGPVRRIGGERAAAMDVMPELFKSNALIIVDDVDDMDGRKFIERLSVEFNRSTEIMQGSRRQFALTYPGGLVE